VWRLTVLLGIAWIGGTSRAEAQLGTLLSPGALTKAHAALAGITNCQKCHEQGRRITAAKCLSCHAPVADRIARKVGVHRNVKGDGDCVTCHVEHSGEDGELRPFDQRAFDHAGVAGFPLDGKHADLAAKCSVCHKTRSFLTVSATCQSCHMDVHSGRLGTACESCHTTRVAFKDVVAGGRFDHSKAAFPLLGAHTSVACTACHINGRFKGLAFSTCTSCHKDPHQPTFGAGCTTCHTIDAWRTTKIDHARTAFPLLGLHASVTCASCHKQGAMKVKPRSNSCAACHADVHFGTFKQDCKACHSETGFAKTPFDHTQTKFPLAGKHAPLACQACHKGAAMPTAKATTNPVVDFRGLQTTCASCHADVHRGDLGAGCESCHSALTFDVKTYKHARFPEFFAGQHAPLTCSQCHHATDAGAPVPTRGAVRAAPATAGRPAVLNIRFKEATTTCRACHVDVHLGQVGAECQRCHNVETAKFAVAGFSHATTTFPLTGKHDAVACAACHKTVTAAFPASVGTAVRLKGLSVECRACHQDVHLGQVNLQCESCHATQTFKLPGYRHTNTRLTDFFVGRHATATCQSCHIQVTRDFPGGRGRAIMFTLDARCTACHRDVHNGSLPNCQGCHRP
jgi:nitrate/TMAO reductase-like tetraheme cytochrome c subunit